jgi:hypothetical protein
MSVHPSYTFALGSFAPIIKMYFNEHNAYFTWALLALEFYRGRVNGHGTLLELDFSENFVIHNLCQAWQ